MKFIIKIKKKKKKKKTFWNFTIYYCLYIYNLKWNLKVLFLLYFYWENNNNNYK